MSDETVLNPESLERALTGMVEQVGSEPEFSSTRGSFTYMTKRQGQHGSGVLEIEFGGGADAEK